MFNFFQKKSKGNRPDSSDRTHKAKSQTVKPESFSVQKKEIINDEKKTTNSPANMIPHVSEKASDLIGKNSYVFKVDKNFNKMIVKRGVESHYGVKVASVHVLNTKPKKRVRGNIMGHKAGYKKAIVQLKDGFKIEL